MNPHAFRIFELWQSVDDRYPEVDRTKSEDMQLPENEFVTRNNKYFKAFDCIDIDGLCVSERARRVFDSLGLPELEFDEQVRVNGRSFFRISTRRMVNCLDRTKSLLRSFPHDPDRVMHVDRYRFRHEMLHDPDLFTIPEKQGSATIYVTTRVEHAIETAGLIGFRLKEMEGFDDPTRVHGPPYRYENGILGISLEIPFDWDVYASPGNRRKKLRPGKPFRASGFVLPPAEEGCVQLLRAEFNSADPYRCAGISLAGRQASNDEDVGDSHFRQDGSETLESHRASRYKWNVNGFEFTYVDETVEGKAVEPVERSAWAEVTPDFWLLVGLAGYRTESFEVAVKVFQTLRQFKVDGNQSAGAERKPSSANESAETAPRARSPATWMDTSVGQTAPIAEAEIASLKQKLNLVLPEYYRQFLMS